MKAVVKSMSVTECIRHLIDMMYFSLSTLEFTLISTCDREAELGPDAPAAAV